MKIRVHYMAQVKQAAGLAEETVELGEGGTVADLVGRVAARHGSRLSDTIADDEGRLRLGILLFVGDERARSDDRPLRDGDEVTFMTPVAGG